MKTILSPYRCAFINYNKKKKKNRFCECLVSNKYFNFC